MCGNRYIENHYGLFRFKEIFKAIIDTLDELSFDMDSNISSTATYFL